MKGKIPIIPILLALCVLKQLPNFVEKPRSLISSPIKSPNTTAATAEILGLNYHHGGDMLFYTQKVYRIFDVLSTIQPSMIRRVGGSSNVLADFKQPRVQQLEANARVPRVRVKTFTQKGRQSPTKDYEMNENVVNPSVFLEHDCAVISRRSSSRKEVEESSLDEVIRSPPNITSGTLKRKQSPLRYEYLKEDDQEVKMALDKSLDEMIQMRNGRNGREPLDQKMDCSETKPVSSVPWPKRVRKASTVSLGQEKESKFTPQSCVHLLSRRGYFFEYEIFEINDEEHELFTKRRWRVMAYEWRMTKGKFKGIGEAPRKALAKESAIYDLLQKLRYNLPDLLIPLCEIPKGALISPFVLNALDRVCAQKGLPKPTFQDNLVSIKGRDKFAVSVYIDDTAYTAAAFDIKFAKLMAAKKAYDAVSDSEFKYDDIVTGEECLDEEEYSLVSTEAQREQLLIKQQELLELKTKLELELLHTKAQLKENTLELLLLDKMGHRPVSSASTSSVIAPIITTTPIVPAVPSYKSYKSSSRSLSPLMNVHDENTSDYTPPPSISSSLFSVVHTTTISSSPTYTTPSKALPTTTTMFHPEPRKRRSKENRYHSRSPMMDVHDGNTSDYTPPSTLSLPVVVASATTTSSPTTKVSSPSNSNSKSVADSQEEKHSTEKSSSDSKDNKRFKGQSTISSTSSSSSRRRRDSENSTTTIGPGKSMKESKVKEGRDNRKRVRDDIKIPKSAVLNRNYRRRTEVSNVEDDEGLMLGSNNKKGKENHSSSHDGSSHSGKRKLDSRKDGEKSAMVSPEGPLTGKGVMNDIDLRFDGLKDVDLRNEASVGSMVVGSASTCGNVDQPPMKKTRNSENANLIIDLFGREDVDLRPSSGSSWSQTKATPQVTDGGSTDDHPLPSTGQQGRNNFLRGVNEHTRRAMRDDESMGPMDMQFGGHLGGRRSDERDKLGGGRLDKDSKNSEADNDHTATGNDQSRREDIGSGGDDRDSRGGRGSRRGGRGRGSGRADNKENDKVGSGDGLGESSIVGPTGPVVPGKSMDLSLLLQEPPNSSNVTNEFDPVKYLGCPTISKSAHPLGQEYTFSINDMEYSVIIEAMTGDILTKAAPYSAGRFIALMKFEKHVRCFANSYGWMSSNGGLHLGYSQDINTVDTLVARIRVIRTTGGKPQTKGSIKTSGCGSTRRDLWGHGNDIVVESIGKIVPCSDANGAEACDRLGRLFFRGKKYDTNLDLHDPKLFDINAAIFVLALYKIQGYCLDIPVHDPCLEYDSKALWTTQYWEDKDAKFEARRAELLNTIRVYKKSQQMAIDDDFGILDLSIATIRDQKDVSSEIQLLKQMRLKLDYAVDVKNIKLSTISKKSKISNNILSNIRSTSTLNIQTTISNLAKLETWATDSGFKFPSDVDMMAATIKKKNMTEEKRIYQCDKCPAKFSDKHNLATHYKVHIGQGFQCSVCDKIFDSTTKLKQHSRSHSGEHPFKCTCGKLFKHKGSLVIHQNVCKACV